MVENRRQPAGHRRKPAFGRCRLGLGLWLSIAPAFFCCSSWGLSGCLVEFEGGGTRNCGNGLMDRSEECDDGNTENGDGCSSACRVEEGWLCSGEPSSCATQCGDELAVGPEACDGPDLRDMTCQSLGLGDGNLGCTDQCIYDPSGCSSQADCGNNAVEYPEECEVNNLNGETCVSLGYADGTLSCDSDCTFDVSQCYVETCGNGVVDDPEECDGADLDGKNCSELGFDGGVLACTETCAFDTSLCTVTPGAVGAACTSDGQCQSGQCLTEGNSGLPGGMCSRNCGRGCAMGEVCVPLNTQDYCFPTCSDTAQCRDGYSCFNPHDTLSAPVCYWNCDDNAQCSNSNACNFWTGLCGGSISGDDNGAACTHSSDCKGPVCFTIAGGYCTSYCSKSKDNCPPGSACVDMYGSSDADMGVCLQTCSGPTDCRPAYICGQNPFDPSQTQTVCHYP